MSVGFPALKPDIDARTGQLVVELRDTFAKIATFKAFLDARDDAALMALGYSSGDVTLLRAAIFDLDKLRQVATAQATQAAPNDFFFNAKSCVGVV
jgi:hypothetical protein